MQIIVLYESLLYNQALYQTHIWCQRWGLCDSRLNTLSGILMTRKKFACVKAFNGAIIHITLRWLSSSRIKVEPMCSLYRCACYILLSKGGVGSILGPPKFTSRLFKSWVKFETESGPRPTKVSPCSEKVCHLKLL